MHRTRVSGFTLIELMVAIAIVAILAAIAFPSFKSTLQSNHVSTAANDLMASFSLARSEAIRSNRGGGICPSKDGAACGGAWNDGWLVWTDANRNGALDTGEPVVRYSQGKAKTLVSGGATVIAFDAQGRAIGGEKKINLKPSDGDTPARCLVMNATGQTRIEKAACT